MLQDSPEGLTQAMFSDRARFQRWLDVEASLARAQASLGMIPASAAESISSKATVDSLDLTRYDGLYQQTGHPMVAFLRLFQPIVDGEAGQFVHLGATTQDVMDTATMMALRDAHAIFYQSLRRIEDPLLDLAERHADTIMVGRTHGVQALPITFGYKVAIWAREIRRNVERLERCGERVFVLQLSGAVGTMAAFGAKGPEIQALVARDLGLSVPDICWHASRDRFAEFANLLALVGGALGRIAQEIYLLMATEVDEVREPWESGIVGSSTMPHKVNPQVCQTMMSLARKLRYEAAFVTEVMVVDHERNLEHFLGEMDALERACTEMGELLTLAERVARGLTVNAPTMRRNLDLLKGLLLSESVMIELGSHLGKQTAHEIVYEDAMDAMRGEASFRDVLLADPRVNKYLGREEIEVLLDPERYVGLASQMARDVVSLSRLERAREEERGRKS
ncbi:MAG: adenylosuccinate lyase [bacterium]